MPFLMRPSPGGTLETYQVQAASASVLLLKVVSYDYIRLRRTTAVVFNNDAKACYDRVIPSIGLMATE